MKSPDFFIVGAPKCGTKSLYTYLKRHPEIFIPDKKEIHHFADDLLRPDDPLLNRDIYLSFFAEAKETQIAGEASVFYLLSRNAAKNISVFNPNAKIFIMLRSPVDAIYSCHSQLVYNGDEPILDFEASLAAEEKRKRGEMLPKHIRFPQKLFYREVAKYAEQVERFFKAFGRDRVQVIIYDDLKHDFGEVYRRSLEFLGVDPDFSPEFKVINANKQVRSRALQQVLQSPPDFIRTVGSRILPGSLKEALMRTVKKANTRYIQRPPLRQELRRELAGEFAHEVAELSRLLGRDLSHWNK